MITIHLHNLLFYAYHGIHEEEKVLGNDYELSADVTFHEENEVIKSIGQTIDYTEMYSIIKNRMEVPSPLLETIIMDIGNSIKLQFDNIRSIHIHLKKLHPPVSGLQGSAGVSWQKQF